jgi:hypothetical protein
VTPTEPPPSEPVVVSPLPEPPVGSWGGVDSVYVLVGGAGSSFVPAARAAPTLRATRVAAPATAIERRRTRVRGGVDEV